MKQTYVIPINKYAMKKTTAYMIIGSLRQESGNILGYVVVLLYYGSRVSNNNL